MSAKLAVCPQWSVEERYATDTSCLMNWLDAIAGLLVDGVILPDELFLSAGSTILEEIPAKLKELGLLMPMLRCSADPTVSDSLARRMQVEVIKGALNTAASMRARYLQLTPIGTQSEVKGEVNLNWLTAVVTQLLPYAQQQGLQLLVTYLSFVQEDSVFYELLEQYPSLRIDYDPASVIMTGADPLLALQRAYPVVSTISAKDVAFDHLHQASPSEARARVAYFKSSHYVNFGLDDVSWELLLTFLRSTNFNGWVVLDSWSPQDTASLAGNLRWLYSRLDRD